jgi:cell division protein FtsB
MKRAKKTAMVTVKKRSRKAKKNGHAERLGRGLRWALSLLVLLVAMHGIFGDHGYLAMRRARADVEKLRREVEQLDEQNQHLSGEVKALKSDPAAIERVAREEMGLAKPGELIFRLPDDPKNPPPSEQPRK